MMQQRAVEMMILIAILAGLGLGAMELMLSPKAAYPLTIARVQQETPEEAVFLPLQGEDAQRATDFPMNINDATAEDLMEAEGVGEKRAQSILEYIARNGKIERMDQLLEIDGIGDKTLQALEELFYAQ